MNAALRKENESLPLMLRQSGLCLQNRFIPAGVQEPAVCSGSTLRYESNKRRLPGGWGYLTACSICMSSSSLGKHSTPLTVELADNIPIVIANGRPKRPGNKLIHINEFVLIGINLLDDFFGFSIVEATHFSQEL